VAGALISIALNPLVFYAIEPARRWILARSEIARRLDRRVDPYAELPMTTETKFLEGQVVLVGYGRVGRRIAADMDAAGIPYVVAELSRETVEDLRKAGKASVSGNAAEPAVLVQAHVAHAAMLVIATPDAAQARQMARTARTLNPGVEIVLRTHSDDELELLRADDIGTIFHGEEELARGMSRHVLGRFKTQER
jgi:CPA2 family monovalent cation:H+ antiporter-2